jgi:hypothetical protein
LKRAKDQIGSMHKVKRAKGPAVWIWRRRVIDAAGIVRHPAATVGTVAEMPTKKAAWTLSQEKRAAVLSGEVAGPKFRELVERINARIRPTYATQDLAQTKAALSASFFRFGVTCH